MVETISPVVYGGRVRWAVALALHVVGATTTAAVFGAASGGLGGLLGAPWGRAGMAALTIVAAVYAIGEMPRVTATVPQLRRQVPDWWRGFFSWPVAALLYGAGLGVGFFTYLSHGTLVVVCAAALASGDPLIGAAVVGVFGLARGFSAARGATIRSQEDSQRLVDVLAGSPERRRAVANGAASAAVGLVAGGLALRTDGGWSSLATAGLAAAFGWAAVSKVVDAAGWRRTLAAHELPGGLEAVARRAVPVAEAAVPTLALAGATKAAGAWALVLVGVFTIEAVRAWRRFGAQVPCGCFGGRAPVAPGALLMRNAALALIALMVASSAGPASRLTWPTAPGEGEMLPMVLSAAGLVLAAATAWSAVRWLGRGEHA
ncbi:MAG TPA: MauE/DoxX family redox-associated membrane protein [Actinomycetota bacterium]